MSKLTVKVEFAIHEAVVLTGFTKAMLDYLSREDILNPSGGTKGRGRRRLYTYTDIVLLRALHTVCQGRGQIRHLKQALRSLRAEIGPLTPSTRLDKLLFVEGDELCLRTPEQAGRQLRTGQLVLFMIVDLDAVSTVVADSLSVFRSGQVELKPRLAKRAEAVRQEIYAPIRARRAST